MFNQNLEIMKIYESNKLIANFMGCADNLHLVESPITGEYTDPDEFLYHTDWDWLMPVVEKIESQLPEGFNVIIELRNCLITGPEYHIEGYSGHSKIEAVYQAVLKYIQD